MKKFLLLITLILVGITSVSAAVSFSAAKVYADWADGYQNALLQFRKIQKEYGTSYDYVELNIAKKETKEYSDNYQIMAGLPYVMLYRKNCKIAKYLDKNCTSSYSCINSGMQTFNR